MQIADYERYVLSACLIDRKAADIVAAELSDQVFQLEHHQLIYRAVLAVRMDSGTPDVGTVAIKLGADLEKAGGQAYLTRVANSLQEAGIYSTAGLPMWAKVVDDAGRIYQMAQVMGNRLIQIQDVDRAIEQIDNVDQFLADTLEELSSANTIRSNYHPISIAVTKARCLLEAEADGKIVSWLPIGWPSLSDYRILPYSSMFVLLGLSSIGKTQLLAQFLLGSAIQLKRYNMPGIVVLNTYETIEEKFTLRMAACLAGTNLLSKSMQDKTSDDFARTMDALDFIECLPISINDATDVDTYQIINQTVLLGAQQGGLRVVGIDYSELVPDKNKHSEEQRVSGIFRNAQRLARISGACVIVLSQFPNEALNDPAKLGGVWMTRYSGSGYHAADIAAIIYNPPQMRRNKISFQLPNGFDADHAYLIIGKNRDGKTGTVKLNWTPGTVRFADPQQVGDAVDPLYEGLYEVQQMINPEMEEGDF